jgi:hypothetical protein
MPDEGVAHLAFDLGLRDQGSDGVDDDAVHAAGADQGLGDLERVLARVRLADEKLVDVYAAGARVARVQGVLDVDEGDDAAAALGLGEDVLAERGLARRLGAEDLGHPAARNAADTEGKVQCDRAGGDDVHGLALGRAETHDRAASELLLDRQNGRIDGLVRSLPAPGEPSGLGPSLDHRHLAPRSCPLRDGRSGRLMASAREFSSRSLRSSASAWASRPRRWSAAPAGLDLGLRRRVLGLLLLLTVGAVSTRHLMRLRVLQATGGLFTPTALPMHATLTAGPRPKLGQPRGERAGAQCRADFGHEV